MELKRIKITKLVGNRGQIPGIPENPRMWDRSDIERLAESLKETPLLSGARPLLVYPHKDKYVVLGGNLRLEAYRKTGAEDVPCFVMDMVPKERLKEVIMKDNSSFGEWDVDELANNWSHLPLSSWGIDVAGLDEGASYTGKNTEVNTDDWKEDMTLKLHFTHEEMEWVRKRMEGRDPRNEILNALGYGGE